MAKEGAKLFTEDMYIEEAEAIQLSFEGTFARGKRKRCEKQRENMSQYDESNVTTLCIVHGKHGLSLDFCDKLLTDHNEAFVAKTKKQNTDMIKMHVTHRDKRKKGENTVFD